MREGVRNPDIKAKEFYSVKNKAFFIFACDQLEHDII